MKNKLVCLLLIIVSGITALNAVEYEKSPLRAMLYSAVVPGGGQIYTEKYVNAALVIGIQALLVTEAIQDNNDKDKYQKRIDGSNSSLDIYNKQQRDKYQDEIRSDYWWIGTTLFLSIADAFVDAHLYNFNKEKDKVHLKFKDKLLQVEYRF